MLKEPNMSTLQVKFGDVAGCDGAKTELVEVVDFLKNSSRLAAIACGYHISYIWRINMRVKVISSGTFLQLLMSFC